MHNQTYKLINEKNTLVSILYVRNLIGLLVQLTWKSYIHVRRPRELINSFEIIYFNC